MTSGKASATGVVVNGWAVFAHPLFLAQLEALAAAASLFPQRGQKAKSLDTSNWQRPHCIDAYYAMC